MGPGGVLYKKQTDTNNNAKSKKQKVPKLKELVAGRWSQVQGSRCSLLRCRFKTLSLSNYVTEEIIEFKNSKNIIYLFYLRLILLFLFLFLFFAPPL